MASKTFNSRWQQKHDTEENWSDSEREDFVPNIGEIIVYDADTTYQTPRVKVGDGKTPIGQLPFFYELLTEQELKTICGVNAY